MCLRYTQGEKLNGFYQHHTSHDATTTALSTKLPVGQDIQMFSNVLIDSDGSGDTTKHK
jgi:hypothetical protein